MNLSGSKYHGLWFAAAVLNYVDAIVLNIDI